MCIDVYTYIFTFSFILEKHTYLYSIIFALLQIMPACVYCLCVLKQEDPCQVGPMLTDKV